MYDILKNAIEKNDSSLVDKLIKDIRGNFESKCKDDVLVAYHDEYELVYNELLIPIYGNIDVLKMIKNLISREEINETLVYVCVYFNLYIKELLTIKTKLWLSDDFLTKIITNNKLDRFPLIESKITKLRHEAIINYLFNSKNLVMFKFYQEYNNRSSADVIASFVNSEYYFHFTDFLTMYCQLDNKDDFELYNKIENEQIRNWLYNHKLTWYNKFRNLIYDNK